MFFQQSAKQKRDVRTSIKRPRFDRAQVVENRLPGWTWSRLGNHLHPQQFAGVHHRVHPTMPLGRKRHKHLPRLNLEYLLFHPPFDTALPDVADFKRRWMRVRPQLVPSFPKSCPADHADQWGQALPGLIGFALYPLPAGGCTIHPSRTLHYTASSLSDAPRRAYILVYHTEPRKLDASRNFYWNHSKCLSRDDRAASAQNADSK